MPEPIVVTRTAFGATVETLPDGAGVPILISVPAGCAGAVMTAAKQSQNIFRNVRAGRDKTKGVRKLGIIGNRRNAGITSCIIDAGVGVSNGFLPARIELSDRLRRKVLR